MAFRALNILSLCAGVGGLELGISLALDYLGKSGRGIVYVEREASAAASLVASMEAGWLHPAPVWSDMLTFDARPWRGIVHILASGDPCQDNSVAGKRAGSSGTRFLAPEVCRLAAECRPDFVFRENVPGNAGEQIEVIVPALEGLGYRVAAGIFSSSETGNTMRRERLFIMAERQGIERSVGERHVRQYLPHTGGSSTGVDGTAGTEWGALNISCGEGWQYDGPQRKESATRSGGPSEIVGDTEIIGREWGSGGAWGGRDGSTSAGPDVGRSGTLAGPSSAELQGQQRGQQNMPRREIKGGPASLRSGTVLRPAVIPGPSDTAGWRAVLDQWPEFQPALSQEEAQSHLRRGIDAMANRTERLRATGNGVDPMVAAYAFLSLGALLTKARPAGQPILSEGAA